MHKNKLEGKKCNSCITPGIQKSLTDIITSMQEATKVFKAKAEETAKKNDGTKSTDDAKKTDDANKTSDAKKTGDTNNTGDAKKTTDSTSGNNSSTDSSTQGSDTSNKTSEFSYVTKTGKKAHIFNINQKGSVVEFDASFEGEKK